MECSCGWVVMVVMGVANTERGKSLMMNMGIIGG